MTPSAKNYLSVPDGANAGRNFSEQTAREIDCEVRALISEGFERSTKILVLHRHALDSGARSLMEKETLTRDELLQLKDASSEDSAAAMDLNNCDHRRLDQSAQKDHHAQAVGVRS